MILLSSLSRSTSCWVAYFSNSFYFLAKTGSFCFKSIADEALSRADEGNNSVFESFSFLSVLVFIEVFAIIFCLLFYRCPSNFRSSSLLLHRNDEIR